MSLSISLLPGTLAPGVCYANDQDRLNDFVEHTSATFDASYTAVILSQAAPGPDDRANLWVQVDGANAIQNILTFSNGAWNGLPKPWTLGQYKTYDPSLWTPGGNIADPWFICNGTVTTVNAQGIGIPDLRGRFIVCTGQRVLPTGSADTNTNFTAGMTGGEEEHFLVTPEMPAHQHLSQLGGAFVTGGTDFGISGGGNNAQEQNGTSIVGGNLGHNNLPPYYAQAIAQWRPDIAAIIGV